MKKLILAGIAMMTVAISSCDSDTNTLGNSVTNVVDKFTIVSDTFDVFTQSMIVDSIYARSSYSYLGSIKDPETGSYVVSDYTTQFNVLEKENEVLFPPEEGVTLTRDDDNRIIADSCSIKITIDSYMGDSLAALKLKVLELGKPIESSKSFYTSFDPEAEGYVRSDGIRQNKVFSVSDLVQSDSVRKLRQDGSLYETIYIPMNDTYTDRNGKSYNNYGSYVMQQYYANPENFKNSQVFAEKICPGFYFKMTDGLGAMMEVYNTQLTIYYHYVVNGKTLHTNKTFLGTEEVLQTTHITSDKENIEHLAADTECTYLKAPDGIFTLVTLPVDDIKRGHENDTITSAKVAFRRMNDTSDYSDIVLQEPQHLLILELDSLYSFFEHRNVPDNVGSYLAAYNQNKNTYSFNNISGLINKMYANRNKSENWNKAVLVPVQVTTTAAATSSTSSTTVASVNNEMRVVSVRLVGGSNNQHEPIRISVVYNQNK